mgnify:CR=1 FL=1
MWAYSINYLLFYIFDFKLMELKDEMAMEKPPKVQKDMLKELGGNSKSKTTLEF